MSLWDLLRGTDSSSPLAGMIMAANNGQAPLVGAVMGSDPRSQAAAAQAGQIGAQAGEAARQYLGDVVTGRVAAGGLQNLNDIFARTRSPDPNERQQALIDLAGTFNFAAPIKAYHGSPYDFNNFSQEKIGTGEGAQAYGHGLYFSEHPEVARTYQSKVSAIRGGGPTIDGRPINWDNPIETAAFELMRHDGNRAAAADFFERTFKNSEVPRILRSDAELPKVTPAGRMYEVNINANPEDFLNWDKPLSEQPTKIQESLRAHIDKLQGGGQPMLSSYMNKFNSGELSGSQVYNGLGRGTPESSTEAWRNAGIPGIRYLDQGSRGAGEGTSNYVVFDPSIIEILRKYGLAGLLGGAGAVAANNPYGTLAPPPQQ